MNHKAVLRTFALSLLFFIPLLHARDVNPVLLSTYPAPPGGTTTDVAASGNLIYACEGEKGLTILDITNPSSPQFVSSIDTPGFASAVVISNNLALVADGTSGLTIVDISNRSSPQIVGAYDTLGNCAGIAISGTLAYLADGAYGLHIVDFSNPTQPVRLGGYNTFGTALSVAISANYAYIADGDNGLVVIDVTNPAIPRKIAGYAGMPATHIAIADAYAYVSSDGPLVIFDISDPLNPEPISSVTLPGFVTASSISGTTAYAASGIGGFHVLDTTDPFAPAILGTTTLFTNAVRVANAGSSAFVADLTNGVRVIAGKNPAVMDVVAHVPIEEAITDIAISGNYAYVAAGQKMQVVNISKIDDARVVASYRAFGEFSTPSISRVAIFDTYAFLAARFSPPDPFEIVSVSDASNPTKIASSTYSGGKAKGEGPYLFLANGGLSIFRASPAGLEEVGGFYKVGTNVYYSTAVFAVRGTNVWAFGTKSSGSPPLPEGAYVFKLNISDPSQPALINDVRVQSFAQSFPSQMTVSDKHAFALFTPYLSSEKATLRALNLDQLFEISSRDASTLKQFAVGTNALYLANGIYGVEVLGLDNALFTSLGAAALPDATAVAVSTRYVFVGAGTNGLYVLTHYQPSVRLATEIGANRTPVVKTFGPIGSSGRLQRATDFTTNSFQDWQTIQLNTYPQIVIDTNSPRAFYRFVSP